MPNTKRQNFTPYYFIIFVVVTAIGLIWYFYYTDSSSVSNTNQNNINTTSQIETKANTNVNHNTNLNANLNANENINTNTAIGGNEDTGLTADLGITVTGYEIERTSSGEVVNLALGSQNNISVMPTSYNGIIRNSISIENEEAVTVAGVSGTKLTGGSAKDGSTISFIIVENNDQLYYFKGTDYFLNNINNIIKFN